MLNNVKPLRMTMHKFANFKYTVVELNSKLENTHSIIAFNFLQKVIFIIF